MDTASQFGARLLDTLARCKGVLKDLAVDLRERSGVSKVVDALEVTTYESGPHVEGYVDAALRNGRSIVWWLDVTWTDLEWCVESRISVIDGSGQHEIVEFPTRSARSLDELIASLEKSTAELVIEADSALQQGLAS